MSKKKIIGSIKGHNIVNLEPLHRELIVSNGTLVWGKCNRHFSLCAKDKGKIGILKGTPILAHSEEKVTHRQYSITDSGVLQKRGANGLLNIYTAPVEDLDTDKDGNLNSSPDGPNGPNISIPGDGIEFVS